MRAKTKYDTLVGTSSADISNLVEGGATLEKLIKSLDEDFDFKKYNPIGLSIMGTFDFSVSFILIDKYKSNPKKDHLVKMTTNITKKDFQYLFRYLNIVLYTNNKYSDYKIDEEI